jgi:hypothetical protein
MIGPHHSIICSLDGIGQGAAAWMAQRSDDTSYFRRTSSGSLRKRTNMVGTSWVCVTWCFGTSAGTPRRRNAP